MRIRTGRITAAIALAALVLSLAAPAAASAFFKDEGDRNTAVPLLVDVLLLRPTGLALTALGTLFYAFPVAPIMAITRPTDIMEPAGPLIMRPARFTFRDPIGQHP